MRTLYSTTLAPGYPGARRDPRECRLGLDVTPERQQLIAETLGRAPLRLVEIDEGYDFEVAIVDDDWVFRFPRRANVVEALEIEIELLPALGCSDSLSTAARSSSRYS